MLLTVHSEIITEVTTNIGGSSLMNCNLTEPQWYKNGTRLDESPKVKPSGSQLHIFCLELSDNGFYECRSKTNMQMKKIYHLIVNNPGQYIYYNIAGRVEGEYI